MGTCPSGHRSARILDAQASGGAYNHGYGFEDASELPLDWNADAFTMLTRLFTPTAASPPPTTQHGRGASTRNDDPDDPEFYEHKEKFDQAEYELLALMRQALSIPEGNPSLPLAGYATAQITGDDCGQLCKPQLTVCRTIPV